MTGNMRWERMELFHAMITVKPTCKPWFPGKNTNGINESGTSVANRLDAARSYSIKKNRHYLKTILEVLLVCSHQEIALRGHDESKNSSNRGNFIEILKLISSHDAIVKEKLTSGPRNAVYTSPIIQNELLHIMGEMVQDIICYKIREAGFFSILVDESKISLGRNR